MSWYVLWDHSVALLLKSDVMGDKFTFMSSIRTHYELKKIYCSDPVEKQKLTYQGWLPSCQTLIW